MSAVPGTSPRVRGVLALILWLAAMAMGGVLIARAQFSADLSAFLPASPDAQQRVLIDQLQSGMPSRTLLMGIDGGTAAQRADASRDLARQLRGSGLFEQVQNGEQDAWKDVGQWLFEHRYQLSPAVTPERFSVDGLRDAIEETLSLLGTPAGSAIKPILDRDPTGETLRIAESLLPASAPRSEQGVWMSRSAPRALLLASTRAAGDDLDAQAAAIAQVRSAFNGLKAPGLTLQLSGPPVFSVTSRAQIEREVKFLAVTGVLVMGSLLMLAFASLRALAVAWLPVVSGVVIGIVAVSMIYGTVHGITLGFGSTLIGEAVDYAIYYLIQARSADATGQGWRRWVKEGWPTVRLGLMTSVCGFAALVFSGFPGLAQLGVFSLAGLLAAALTARYVLPVLMPNGASGLGMRRQMGRVFAKALRWLPRLRHAFLLMGLVSLALLVWQRGALWQGDLASLSPVPRDAMALDESLRADLSASDAGTLVVVQAADQESALRTAEAAAARLDALVAQGVLAGFDSPTRMLPSQATQRQRLQSLPDTATLRERLAQATDGGPLRAERLARFLVDV
jgi:predicted exporter